MASDDVAEAFGGGVEVAAGGVQGAVPVEGLELDDVGTGLEGVGGEGVAESVDHGTGGDAGADTGSGVEAFDEVADLVDGEAAASGVDEQGSGGVVELNVGEPGGPAGLGEKDFGVV